jgi:hypothetical protein
VVRSPAMGTRKKLAAAVELGRRGGLKRVKKGFAMMKPEDLAATVERAVAARRAKMTPDERSAVAKKAAAARWGKRPASKKQPGKKPE